MLPSFLLALREGVEAALIIGILFGALRKLDRSNLAPSVWLGVVSAIAVSVLVAVGLNLAGAELEGRAEAIFEGVTMIAAAALLTWMIFWMRRQSRMLRGEIEHNVRQALNSGGGRALFGVAFLAVVREGIELALFLVAAGLATNATNELLGALVGLVAAAGLGWLLFSSTRRLPLGRFFQVTNILLILFAAGLVTHGVHEFIEVGWLLPFVEHVYNLNPLLSQSSVTGQLLTTLFGYNASPSLTEMVVYLTYFLILLLVIIRGQRLPATAAVSRKVASGN